MGPRHASGKIGNGSGLRASNVNGRIELENRRHIHEKGEPIGSPFFVPPLNATALWPPADSLAFSRHEVTPGIAATAPDEGFRHHSPLVGRTYALMLEGAGFVTLSSVL